MKPIIIFSFLLGSALASHAERDIRFYMNNGEVKSVAVSSLDSLSFDETSDKLTLTMISGQVAAIPLSIVDSMRYDELPSSVHIAYQGDQAQVLNPYAFDGVEASIQGARVTLVSSLDKEVAYHLTGESQNGAFKLYGVKKYELHLDNLSLTNDEGAPINIQCKKRGQVFLTEGTSNYLADSPEYAMVEGEDQKGTFFSEGQLVFNGTGSLTIHGGYKHALCTDDYFAINGGSLHLISDIGDGLHANDSILIRGGTLTIQASADAIDCQEYLSIENGQINIHSTTDDVKGLKTDADVRISGGEVNVTMEGDMAKAIKSKGSTHIEEGKVLITTKGTASTDTEGDISYATAIKCDGHYIQSGGQLTIHTIGMGGQGISADSTLTISGGEVNITIAGKGSSYTTSSGTTDYYSVKALKSDGAMNLIGGNIQCQATGQGGKAIVADGILTIGSAAESTGPTLSATTSGSAISTSLGNVGGGGGAPGGGNGPGGGGWFPGGGGGGFPGGGGGMMGGGFNGAPKAIKGDADVIIHGGDIYVSTKSDGGEGIESKAQMSINGGTIQCATYDDGINAAKQLTINGGIDSNGSLYINGGIIMTSGTSSPEEGFDCDFNTFVIKGGILIGTGGATSNPTSATQPYSTLSSVSLSSGKYLSVKDNSGKVLFSYRLPNTISRGTVLISSPDFTKSSHTLVYGVTSVSSPTDTLFGGVFYEGGTLTGGSTKNFTPSTK